MISPAFEHLDFVQPLSKVVTIPLRHSRHQYQSSTNSKRPRRGFNEVLGDSIVCVIRRVGDRHIELPCPFTELSIVVEFGRHVRQFVDLCTTANAIDGS